MNLSLLASLNRQKNTLIYQIPELKYFFVNIYDSTLNANIPFLPIRAFRDFSISIHQKSDETTTFLSSGSTNAIKAQHKFTADGLKNYALNSCDGFEQFLKKNNFQNSIIISLVPSPTVWPQSSISAMLQMFKDCNYPVVWCAKEDDFLNILSTTPLDKNILVFGTTFHHLLLIEHIHTNNFLKKFHEALEHRTMTIIDTGGTKGRTRAFTPQEIDNSLKDFYASENTTIFSEYGMCELGSQAWSANSEHNSIFQANKTLTPFALDLQNNCTLPSNQKGFLGFIDEVNVNSYQAIITEDFGEIISQNERIFKLNGRASNASIKGCSLNVSFLQSGLKTFAQSVISVSDEIIQKALHNQDTRKFSLEKLLVGLDTKIWSSDDLIDIKKALQSLDGMPLSLAKVSETEEFNTLRNENFQNQKILLLAAANTPISFVYPLVICALNKAQSFTLKIPSLRVNDPLSVQITQQIINLFYHLASFFQKTKFQLYTNTSLSAEFKNFDALMVFGTDETIQLLKKSCSQKIDFYGFGDIKNSFFVETLKHNSFFLANMCSAWYGRGCLTPLCFFVDEMWTYQHTLDFYKVFDETLSTRLANLNSNQNHDHFRLQCMAQLRKVFDKNKQSNNKSSTDIHTGSDLTLQRSICFSEFVTVVDLTGLSKAQVQLFNTDVSFAGGGFVYIMSKGNKDLFPLLSEKCVYPTIQDFQFIMPTES